MIKSDFEKLGESFSAIGRERLDLLLPLVPLAPDDVLPDLLCLGLAAYHFPQQDEFLSSLAKRTSQGSPEAKKRAMMALRSLDVLSELDSATEFVTQLVPFLPDDVVPLALETSLRSGQPFARMGLLLALAQRVVPNNWVAILRRFLQQKAQELRASDQETQGFEIAYFSTESLVGLCSFVPEELQQEVLEVVRVLSDPSVRAQLLLRLALERQHDEATRESLLEEAWRDWQQRPDASSWSDERSRFSSSLGRLPERWRTRWIEALTKEAFEKAGQSDSYSQREKRAAVWPLLSSAFQDRWLREQIHHALALPQHAFHFERSYSGQVDIFPVNLRANALKDLSRLLTDELAPYAVLGALTLSHLPTRLEVLQELSFVGEPGAERVQENTLHMTLELIASLEPSSERVLLCARLAYNAEGKMREQVVETGFVVLKGLTTGQGMALRELGPYVPASAIPEAISVLAACSIEEKREYSEYLLPHFAPKWP